MEIVDCFVYLVITFFAHALSLLVVSKTLGARGDQLPYVRSLIAEEAGGVLAVQHFGCPFGHIGAASAWDRVGVFSR